MVVLELGDASRSHNTRVEEAIWIPVVKDHMRGNGHRARALSEECHAFLVTAEFGDVFLNPFHRRPLIFEVKVRDSCVGDFLGGKAAKRIHTVIGRDEDNRLTHLNRSLNKSRTLIDQSLHSSGFRSQRSA